MSGTELTGWDRLRHGGLLLDPQRLQQVASYVPDALPAFLEGELRRQAIAMLDNGGGASASATFLLERICGFTADTGSWQRGNNVPTDWGRVVVTGTTVKPNHLWLGREGGVLPVFLDSEKRVGIGRGRKVTSQVLQWLRAGREQLAVVTNGRQWRLVFAGLDFDAWCEWDVDLWFEEGALSPQVTALRTLLLPALWTPVDEDRPCPLLQAILDSRKGQAELSEILGERVREAVEVLIQAHSGPLEERCADLDSADIYRAAVRVVMRMVVVLFAESRDLLPRDHALYHGAYGLTGLLEELEKIAARGGNRLARSSSAWPRVLALFRLVHDGSHHPDLLVPAYGGELFASGRSDSPDGLIRALEVFETACFEHEVLPDRDVHRMLERITRTRVKVRQGRSSTWVPAPVDFSDLSSEYIGILYEGLLEFELKTAPVDDAMIFLAIGNQPALPLNRLEAMDDKALKDLFAKLKDTSSAEGDDEEAEASEETEEAGEEDEEEDADEFDTDAVDAVAEGEDEEETDARHTTRVRAEEWARRAVEIGKLARKPRGKMTPEKRLRYDEAAARKARQLVTRVVLPGERYLVRWGGTRKGSGTFYTRPGLAVPTVMRTLRPLAYDPPVGADGTPDVDAAPTAWTPKRPEEILALKVCDPACGSGSFPVAALRFLTNSLYESVLFYERLTGDMGQPLDEILGLRAETPDNELLSATRLPGRPADDGFEDQIKALLKRYVVERCIYGVDLDPLAVELCRLALWIETMDRTLPFSFVDHKVKCGNSLVGAWFDQFQHYPAMAWKNREGGDKSHNNGVHFEKEARTKAIKAFVKEHLQPDLAAFLAGPTLFSEDQQEQALAVHDDALATLSRLHELPVQDSVERARVYRKELLGSEAYHSLKEAMDLWCACWFWPAENLEHAPLPSTLAEPDDATRAIVARVATDKLFFHWELEFPDVFREVGSGFDAIIGNPPWNIVNPRSKEFFSNIDPLYRSYEKQEALRYQTSYFKNELIERNWIDYKGDFRAQTNFMNYSASAFGDPQEHEKSQDRFSISRGHANAGLHSQWRSTRAKCRGYSDSAHCFRHQGSGGINLYKLFLEQTHALLRDGGRLGFIVPSSLCSDLGAGALRVLFLDHCKWEWIFGFENREKIFPIDSRFKFNAVIVEKGGATKAIRTAFMRRRLEDWEQGEALATPYTNEQVERFSPHSRAILEIHSARDLEILEKIYVKSVLLGDDSPAGWGIEYGREFHMTDDSKLFPPRRKWEEQGYIPDEYSRWLKGEWRPRSHDGPAPVGVKRVDIPEGVILSRDGESWIAEGRVDDIALPLLEGRMIGQFDFSEKGWVSGHGRGAVWRLVPFEAKQYEPQFLGAKKDLETVNNNLCISRPHIMRITSSTNSRTLKVALAKNVAGEANTPVLLPRDHLNSLLLISALNSIIFDYQIRVRVGGLTADWHFLEQAAISRPNSLPSHLSLLAARLNCNNVSFALEWLYLLKASNDCLTCWKKEWALLNSERLRLRCIVDALLATVVELDIQGFSFLLQECDYSPSRLRLISNRLNPRGFWRVDKKKDPELRHTVLSLVAFHDLQQKIEECGGDRDRGIKVFCSQNDGEGWMLPERLRLADYDLGHDERAKEHQPVASRLGPRFYDWQLEQDPEESWRECHLHARNLLGETGYQQLLKDIEAEKRGEKARPSEPTTGPEPEETQRQTTLFD